MKGTPAMLLDRQGQTAASRSLFTEKTAILICPKEPFISAREEELSLLKYSLEMQLTLITKTNKTYSHIKLLFQIYSQRVGIVKIFYCIWLYTSFVVIIHRHGG